MKALTREQLAKRKEKAVRFVRDVREDDELADEIEDESLEDYAEHRHVRLLNPSRKIPRKSEDFSPERRSKPMPVPTRRELQERIEELESENEDLQSRLDEIADLVAPEEEEESGE
jgi:hypothetical protein